MFSVIFLLRCVLNSNLSSQKSFDVEQKIEFAGDVRLMLPVLWSGSITDVLNC